MEPLFGQTVIALLCGLPASGKSTVARQLQERLNDKERLQVVSLVFDDFLHRELGSAAWSPSAWHRARGSFIQTCSLLANRQRSSTAMRDPQLLLLVEDNFYLGSMRRTFYNIARSCE